MCAGFSTRRQAAHGVKRFALIPHFEMQHDPIAIGLAHRGNLFAGRDALTFFDQ